MKNTKLVKLIALMIAIIMTAAVFAGCADTTTDESSKEESKVSEESKTEESADDETSEDESTGYTGEKVADLGIPPILKDDPDDMYWMYNTDPITLTVYVNGLITDDWQWGDDVTTQYITERTGITLDMEWAPDAEGTRLNLMLAGGETLPDIFQAIPPTSTVAGELVTGEYVLCAEDLINEYAPEMWDVYTPYQKQYAATTDDGKMWPFLVGYDFDGENHSGYMHGYIGGRGDILEALGTKNTEIKTIDDFRQVLDDFNAVWKTDYPDIVYPVLMRGVCSQFSAVFGEIGCGSDLRYDPETGECYFWFQSEEGYNTLKFYNELYRNGYLPEEAFITTDSSIDLMGAGKVLFFIASNTWESSSANAPVKENVGEDAYFAPIYPFTADGKEILNTFKGISYNGSGAWVTADCKAPDRATGFMEYSATEEGILTLNCGIYGEHWDVKTDDDGYLYPAFIAEEYTSNPGSAGQAAMKEAYGINNHEHSLWFGHTTAYNFLWNYDTIFMSGTTNPNILAGRSLWYSATTDNENLAGVTATFSVAASSDAGVALAALSDIYSSELAKMIFLNSDEEFDAAYNAMLDALKAAGEDNFWSLYEPMFADYLAKYQEALASK